MSISYIQRSLSWFVSQLRHREPLAFSRWGDGEWNSVLSLKNEAVANCDGHHYIAAMGNDLGDVLRAKPDYVLGMQPLATQMTMSCHIKQFLTTNGLHTLDWIDADVFHLASEYGKLDSFVHALRELPLVVVGPRHLRALIDLRPIAFVEVPCRDSYWTLADTVAAVRDLVAPRPYCVVSVSMGMPAGLLVDQLHREHPGHAYLDLGSLWDPYAGVRSRNYMRRKRGGFALPLEET